MAKMFDRETLEAARGMTPDFEAFLDETGYTSLEFLAGVALFVRDEILPDFNTEANQALDEFVRLLD